MSCRESRAGVHSRQSCFHLFQWFLTKSPLLVFQGICRQTPLILVLQSHIFLLLPGKGQSFEDSDVAPYRRPRVLDEAEPSSTNPKPAKMVDMDVDDYKPPIKALPEKKRETAYMSTVREQKDRVTRIRRARRAAEVIQRAWKNYRLK